MEHGLPEANSNTIVVTTPTFGRRFHIFFEDDATFQDVAECAKELAQHATDAAKFRMVKEPTHST